MKLSIVPFFKKVHLSLTSRSYLLRSIEKDTILTSILYFFSLLIISSLITASIRYARIKDEFPSQFVETFGELTLGNGEIISGIDSATTIPKRSLSQLSSTLFGLAVPPSEMVAVALTPNANKELAYKNIQFTPKGYLLTASTGGFFSSDTTYESTFYVWPTIGDSKQSVTLSLEFLNQYIHTNGVAIVLSLWIVFAVISISLLLSYLFFLFILVFIYGRKDPILGRAGVRFKLVLYLMTPYFILFPLFAIVADGLGNVSGMALVVSSIILIRLSYFLKLQNSSRESNE